MNRNRVVGFVALGLLAVMAFYAFRPPSAEMQIRSRLAALTELAKRAPGESDTGMLIRAKRMSSFLSKMVEVEYEGRQEERSRLQLRDAYASFAHMVERLDVESAIESLNVEGERATAVLRVAGHGNDTEGEEFLEVHRGELVLEKLEGEWVIARGVHLENLRE